MWLIACCGKWTGEQPRKHEGEEAVMLDAALSYARRWPVLPLHTPRDGGCSCREGASCPKTGKHPRTKSGLKDASADPRQIHAWWSRWPDANIGILTGSESGLLVLDVDNKGGKRGGDNLVMLAADHSGIPSTLTATTGSGEHLFFAHPGVEIRNSVSTLAEGVDVRAERGYVVAAPSLHANGKRYDWKDSEHALAEIPDWLLARMTRKEKSTKTMQDMERNAYTDAPVVNEGERNDTLYKLGCALRGQQGMERNEIVSILLEYNTVKCDPPLDQTEVLKIAASVCLHPREVKTNKSGKRLEQNPLYWFPFNTREWFANQNLAIMTDVQTGWYIRLKAFAWDQGGFLPADPDKLWRLAKAKSIKAFERDRGLVLADFEEVEVDGERKLKNPKMTAQYANTLEDWMKKKEAGEASKAARMAALQSSPQPKTTAPAPLLTVQ